MLNFLDKTGDEAKPVEPWKDSARLQTKIRPLCYELILRPQFPNTLVGKETITVEVTQPTTYFAVHAKNLKVTNTKVTPLTDDIVNFTMDRSFAYEPHDFWIIGMKQSVAPGTYQLEFDYELDLKTNFHGLFLGSSYREKLNESSLMIATQFKPYQARQTYPCFDEPDIRANYKLRIVKPMPRYKALANAGSENELEAEENVMTVYFKETGAIPTYLSGFIIADLKEIARRSVDCPYDSKFVLTFYAVEDKSDEAVLARDIASRVTKYFVNYFETPLGLNKLDFIAVPDFPVPTLEHWGFVLFNESLLLYDEYSLSNIDKVNTALAVSREICRQWFGCLVTMKSWKDFWLTEGFIRMMQYNALEREDIEDFKNWKLNERLILDVIHPVLDADALGRLAPLDADTEINDKKKPIVDDLTAYKGLAVLRMLESWVGAETFRRIVNKFLDNFAMSSATAQDFWKLVNSEYRNPEVNVKEVMDTWTKQSGYPIIYAVRRGNTWILSQTRFLVDAEEFCDPNDSPYRFKWDVPIHYFTSNDSRPVLVWFKRTDECVRITIPDRTVSFLKFNPSQTGLYRVNYEGCLWRQFSHILQQEHTRFDVLDRSNLLDDLFFSAEAGETDYNCVLYMMKYLENERDYLPWATASRNILRLANRLYNTSYFGLLFKFIKSLVSRIYGNAEGQFSWSSCPSDSLGDRWFRILIVELAALSKLPGCISELCIKFKEWIKTGVLPVDYDLMRLLLKYGMREIGNAEDWAIVYSRYEKESNENMRSWLLECLANLREHWELYGLFGERSEIHETDHMTFFKYLSENPYSSNFFWTFVRNQWDLLSERFSSCKREFEETMMQVMMRFNSPCQYEEVEMFYQKHPEFGAELDAKRITIDRIRKNIRFLEMHGTAITISLCEM